MKKLIAGNWKMNLGLEEAKKLVNGIENDSEVDVLVAPIFPILFPVSSLCQDKGVLLAAQNCHEEQSGAFTGEVPAVLLKEISCTHVIIGHSERRTIYGERDDLIAEKAKAALDAGLKPIICIGETEGEREEGITNKVIERQLIKIHEIAKGLEDVGLLTIAYEPVWAIGTGKTPTHKQIQEAHSFIRETLLKEIGSQAESIRILYGGSLKPENAKEILSIKNVDGGLIGGASLKTESFNALIKIAASINA